MTKTVTLYHQPGCGDCRAAEEFLRQKGVTYDSRDITADAKARDELVNKWQSRTTATLVIDGEAIKGFQSNRQRVEHLLAGAA
jgi:glutaredoxin 3